MSNNNAKELLAKTIEKINGAYAHATIRAYKKISWTLSLTVTRKTKVPSQPIQA